MKTKLLEPILKYPAIYSMVPKILGAEPTENFIERYFKPTPGMRILDIGCGPAKIRKFLPDNIEYYGFDPNPLYIEEARETYGSKGHFSVSTVEDYNADSSQKYDLVIAIGVLHHLNNQVVHQLFELAKRSLATEGRFLSSDPCFHKGQSWAARFLAKMDRGDFVRADTAIKTLAQPHFSDIKMEVRQDRLKNVPYSHVILKASNP